MKGASNQFALAAAQRVAETPARSYNPLFVYGSAGLGKTHLLHAIGHYVESHYQHHVVRYVSTESFMNEFVDAIRSNSMAGLRRRYRELMFFSSTTCSFSKVGKVCRKSSSIHSMPFMGRISRSSSQATECQMRYQPLKNVFVGVSSGVLSPTFSLLI